MLIQQIDLLQALQDAGSNLFVLSSGPTPPNPSEVLASSYVREVIRSLLAPSGGGTNPSRTGN